MANDEPPKESDVDRFDEEIRKFVETLKGAEPGLENAIDEAFKRIAERDYEMNRHDVEDDVYRSSDERGHGQDGNNDA